MIDPELRDREEWLSAALTVATSAEIKALFLEFQAAGVTFFQTLKRQPWGAKNFIVRDPDGNLLCSPDRRSRASPPILRWLAVAADFRRQSGHTQSLASDGIGRRNDSSEHQHGPDGCRRIPCRSWRRRGGARPGFLGDLSCTRRLCRGINPGFMAKGITLGSKSKGSSRAYTRMGRTDIPMARDSQAALIALNRFGLGARGGARAISSMRRPIHAGLSRRN